MLIQEENPPEYELEEELDVIIKLAQIDFVYEGLFGEKKNEKNTINAR